MKPESIVHYLCKDNDGLLKYPRELPDNHQTLGSLFVIGSSDQQTFYSYQLKALDNDEVVAFELNRIDGNANFYKVKHDDFGEFMFYLENIFRYRWIVESPFLRAEQPMYALGRFRAWNHQLFDFACRSKNFYFIGEAFVE